MFLHKTQLQDVNTNNSAIIVWKQREKCSLLTTFPEVTELNLAQTGHDMPIIF